MKDNLLTEEREDLIAKGKVPNAQETGKQASAKPANLPEKFWDENKGEVRVDALLQSYLELEKKLSAPAFSADTPEGKARLYKTLGVPESPEEYTIDLRHGLFEADPSINARLHKLGFTPAQVQEVYDLAAEKLVPVIMELADEFKADREVERLISAFGGAEKWAEISRQLQAFGRKNLPEDVLRSLASSFEGVMALYRMMGGTEPGLARVDEAAGPASEKDLQSMMRDPRYWREKDPSFVEKVSEGFRRLYQNA